MLWIILRREIPVLIASQAQTLSLISSASQNRQTFGINNNKMTFSINQTDILLHINIIKILSNTSSIIIVKITNSTNTII